MDENQTPPDLAGFAKQLVDETRKQIRDQFELFKATAFPDAKQDALDYESVCLIHGEFRKQEDSCVAVLEGIFSTFSRDYDGWLERFKHAANAYTRIGGGIADSYITGIRGLAFTYDVHPSCIPTRAMESWIQESEAKRAEFLRRHESTTRRFTSVFARVNADLKKRCSSIEQSFHCAMRELVEITLPASHRNVEAIIRQNTLQRQGADHHLN